jgi:outer membrane protein assembly factor BamB
VGAQRTRQLSGPTGGRLFAAGMDGVVAVDAASGAQLWTWSSNVVSVAALAIGDVVYVMTFNGDLVVLDAATGAERLRLPLGGLPLVDPSPAPDGTLLVATDGQTGSDLFAIRRAEVP